MSFEFDLIQTMGIAVIVYFIGYWIKSKVKLFQTYFIPAPVIGGLLASLLIFVLKSSGMEIVFDFTLQDFFMNIFFTCTGFTCSWAVLRKSGKLGAFLAIGAVVFLVVQNAVGVGLASLLGIHPLLGVAIGSVSMSGGVGSAASFGPTMEQAGAVGATTIGIAAATFGLLLGSIVGGPVANLLIKKYNLTSKGGEKIGESETHEIAKAKNHNLSYSPP